jgi:hypothetical protein
VTDTSDSPGDERVYRLRAEALDWLEADDEVIALDAVQSQYLATNPSGALLWRELGNGATRTQLAQVLADAYDIPLDRAEADVAAYLEALSEQNLLADEDAD